MSVIICILWFSERKFRSFFYTWHVALNMWNTCARMRVYASLIVYIFFFYRRKLKLFFSFYSGPMSIDSEPLQAANIKSQCKKSVTGIHNNNNNCIQFPNKESTGSLGKCSLCLYIFTKAEEFIPLDWLMFYRQN